MYHALCQDEASNSRNPQSGEPETNQGLERREVLGEKASPGPLGDFIMSSTALGVAKTVNTPLIDLSTTNIFQGQVKMTFGLSAQFGYLCHLSPFLAWTAEIYMLSGGLFTDESALELMRVGEDSGLRPQMKFLFWFSH